MRTASTGWASWVRNNAFLVPSRAVASRSSSSVENGTSCSSSPRRDWCYVVADYCGVHPGLGTLTDLDELTAAAAERDIQVVLDLVPAHTSDRHAWFRESRSARESPRRDWYIWRDEADEQQSV